MMRNALIEARKGPSEQWDFLELGYPSWSLQ